MNKPDVLLAAVLDGSYSATGRPLVFVDFDDVICLSAPYGGFDVFSPDEKHPPDLWEKLWHSPSIEILACVVREFRAEIVLTTSWLQLADRQRFEEIFDLTGYPELASALHAAWEAPYVRSSTRLESVKKWLHMHYRGQPFVVIDDELSGSGLSGSALDNAGRVVLCAVSVGLQARHLQPIRAALIEG